MAGKTAPVDVDSIVPPELLWKLRRRLTALLLITVLGLLASVLLRGAAATGQGAAPPDPQVVAYSAEHPNLRVVKGRVIAESRPQLSAAQRSALWREYGLTLEFEWLRPTTDSGALPPPPLHVDSGFTYHELRIRGWTAAERMQHGLRGCAASLLGRPSPAPLPSRELPALLAALNDDPRLNWSAPDALLLEWADSGGPADPDDDWTDALPPGPEDEPAPAPENPAAPDETRPGHFALDGAPLNERSASLAAALPPLDGMLRGGYSAGLLSHEYKALPTVAAWEDSLRNMQAQSSDKNPQVLPGPLPEFEYYRLANPEGSKVEWAPELAGSALFMQHCGTVYGTGQASALAAYQAQGSPPLSPVTVVIADTGVLRSHLELAAVMHPNAMDCNYSSLRFPRPAELAAPNLEVVERERDSAAGLPREAIRGKPADHGTNCAGVVLRCTQGFVTAGGAPAVRLLAVSLKSDKAVAIDRGRLKTPISSFIRLVYALNEHFPTGSYTPGPGDLAQNTGDVRVVSVSASVPKSMFSDAQWRIVANLAGKAAGAIAEDLRSNDRLYVFAAGNEAQSEPNKPADVDYVLSVSAARAMDGSAAWQLPQFKEGSNVGPACVSAPGEGILSSAIYPHPNLRYLPEGEFRSRANWSVPNTGRQWREQTIGFSATSSATPQVAALAALRYAQDSGMRHMEVIEDIRASTAGRILTAPYGSSAGLVDYRLVLGWGLE